MTHEYTILVAGVVIPGGEAPGCTAIAWAGDTILALGSDEVVRAISRGDSHVVDLGGAAVVALEGGTLEIGGRADLAVVGNGGVLRAVIRRGRLESGDLPGLEPHHH